MTVQVLTGYISIRQQELQTIDGSYEAVATNGAYQYTQGYQSTGNLDYSVQQLLSCPGSGVDNTEAFDLGYENGQGGPCGGGQPATALRALSGNLQDMALAESEAEINGTEAVLSAAYRHYNRELLVAALRHVFLFFSYLLILSSHS